MRCEAEVLLPTRFGDFRARVYLDDVEGQTHIALIAGEPEGKQDVLAYVHSPCLMGDALQSLGCDCGTLLEAAMLRVQSEGEGVVIYPRAEARPLNLLDASLCQAKGGASANQGSTALDDYALGTSILWAIGLGRVRRLTAPR